MGPWLYEVELSIGGQQFRGKGRTRQAAKHDAAAKALKILQNEPLPEKPEVVYLKHSPAPHVSVYFADCQTLLWTNVVAFSLHVQSHFLFVRLKFRLADAWFLLYVLWQIFCFCP